MLFFSSSFLNLAKVDELMGGVDVFFSWRKNIWYNFEMNPLWQSRFSDKIIAVSNSTTHNPTNIYGVDPVKIKVMYSGVSLGISPDIQRLSAEEFLRFKIKNKLPVKSILFLGKLEPRKNISRGSKSL